MPFDLGSFAGAIGSGIGQGLQTREELERLARRQLMADSLARAQIANYQNEARNRDLATQSEIQRRADQTANERRRLDDAASRPRGQAGRWVQDTTGEWIFLPDPVAPQATAPEPAAPSLAPAIGGPSFPGAIVTNASGAAPAIHTGVRGRVPGRATRTASASGTRIPGYTYTADNRAVITTRLPDGTLKQDTLSTGKAPNTQQLQSASQLPAAEDAAQTLARIAQYHPEAFAAGIAFLRAKHHTRLGGQLIAEARGKLADPDANRVVQAYNAYLLATLPNARPNVTTIDLESEASIPAIGSDPATWRDALRMVQERVSALRIRSGGAAGPNTNRPPARFLP